MTTPDRLDHRAASGALTGATVAERYLVERELGRGGMATVYLARDLRHDRQVALKLLEAHIAPDGAERFLREIHIASRLTHPHVLGVHDSGEFNGRLFYVMPYVAGETLRSRLTRDGALPIGETIRLTRELADALAYAHENGVIHRDLKPENVLLSGGHAVVADFGIAKAIAAVSETGAASSERLTRTGMALGTPAYMAPEQAVGDASTDHRADLYALGLTAYEMLTGAHPFAGRSMQALAAAHLTEAPPPLAQRRPDTPAAFSALVMQLLAKDPAARPQSADVVRRSLDELGTAATETRRRSRGPTLTIGAAAAAVIVAVVATYAVRARPRPTAEAAQVQTVAVLPFANVGGGPNDEYFSDGLTDELTAALSRIPGLRLSGRASTYSLKGKTVAAREIGRVLDVGAYVGGSVRRAGDRLRVSTQLVSTADGKVLWDSVFESHSGDIFAVQDSLTRAVVASLGPKLGLRGSDVRRPSGADDVKRGTADETAYELYLKGMYYWHERGADNVKRSIDLFQQAIARDPRFARAYAGLAFAYGVLGVYVPDPSDSTLRLIKTAAASAIALDSTLADAQQALASALEGEFRWSEAEAHYRTALRIEPSNEFAHHSLGAMLVTLGHTEQAIAELRIATRLDPLAKSAGTMLAEALIDARRFRESEAESRRLLAIDSTFVLTLSSLGLAQALEGQTDSAVRTLERGLRLYPDYGLLQQRLLFAYDAAGRRADVERMRAHLRLPGADNTDGLLAGYADLLLGAREPLMRLLTTREGERRWFDLLRGGGCNPLDDPLWNDERYRTAMRALGIDPCPLAQPGSAPGRPAR
jgi:serine/threonine-protein kinase